MDKDLYEDLTHEEMLEILEEEKKQGKKSYQKTKSRFPKWPFWLIAVALFIQVIAMVPKSFPIAAIDFLSTSSRLMTDSNIDEYQKAVVVVEAGASRGTGFAYTENGLILTNHHVIDGALKEQIYVAFPEAGLKDANIVAEYPEIDLALLQVESEDSVPFLPLAEKATFKKDEHIYFIGNPLRFEGIANEGEVIGYTSIESMDKEVLMLDASVYHGNSGSPVITEEGEVMGIIFATLDHPEHGRVGLAVPIDYFHDVYHD
ncbi:trypsin-like peptidase domain-containing protein [Radiobacillus deserti]|uniref:Trypsin-like peptidase domain-containing protein n=2 Tax=Radiobacillus deserti TaxID=2594883 RepID=A0A516KL30_9BACI|nr:trypsin-like peptidase domain-containing protein [Radiobacillus deserti]